MGKGGGGGGEGGGWGGGGREVGVEMEEEREGRSRFAMGRGGEGEGDGGSVWVGGTFPVLVRMVTTGVVMVVAMVMVGRCVSGEVVCELWDSHGRGRP